MQDVLSVESAPRRQPPPPSPPPCRHAAGNEVRSESRRGSTIRVVISFIVRFQLRPRSPRLRSASQRHCAPHASPRTPPLASHRSRTGHAQSCIKFNCNIETCCSKSRWVTHQCFAYKLRARCENPFPAQQQSITPLPRSAAATSPPPTTARPPPPLTPPLRLPCQLPGAPDIHISLGF